MIKTNELRIGNRVRFSENHTVWEVLEINATGLLVANEEEETWIEIDQFEPIPLTEDWLLKLGFNDGFIETELYTISVVYYDNWNIFFNEKAVKYAMEFYFSGFPSIHEIQNLFFIFTNQELTLCQ